MSSAVPEDIDPRDITLPLPYEHLARLLKDPGASKGSWALKIQRFPDRPPRRGFQCATCKTWRYSREPMAKSLTWMRCDCDESEGNPTGGAFNMAYRANQTVGAWIRLNGMDAEANVAIRDLVNDLLHLAEAVGLDPSEELQAAYSSFLSETGQAPL
jgi:hypothetical protein